MHQVFINLIVNAQQALSDRPEPRRIRIISGYDPSTKEIRVEVADNGPGIPEAIRSRIFDPYFTTKPAGIGTGIGLAVSQGIVEAQGGILAVICPPEGGAIFVVRFPAHNSGDVLCQSESCNSMAPHKDRKHILIIDDEPDVAALLADILANGQRSIDVAASGHEALGVITRQGCYHAILTDLRMPGMDGVSLYREIEQRWPDLARKVVFVTGDALSPQVQNLLRETGCAIIEKPFVPSEVRQKIDVLLAPKTTSSNAAD
jgi:two-component system NtrC family sensor kinase